MILLKSRTVTKCVPLCFYTGEGFTIEELAQKLYSGEVDEEMEKKGEKLRESYEKFCEMFFTMRGGERI